MIGDTDNPFDVLGLEPTASPEEITESLRERIEDASPQERVRLRALWERLLRHPRERVLLALGAHPRAPWVARLPAQPRDAAAIAAVASFVPPPDELVVVPLASSATAPGPHVDPIASLATELGELT